MEGWSGGRGGGVEGRSGGGPNLPRADADRRATLRRLELREKGRAVGEQRCLCLGEAAPQHIPTAAQRRRRPSVAPAPAQPHLVCVGRVAGLGAQGCRPRAASPPSTRRPRPFHPQAHRTYFHLPRATYQPHLVLQRRRRRRRAAAAATGRAAERRQGRQGRAGRKRRQIPHQIFRRISHRISRATSRPISRARAAARAAELVQPPGRWREIPGRWRERGGMRGGLRGRLRGRIRAGESAAAAAAATAAGLQQRRRQCPALAADRGAPRVVDLPHLVRVRVRARARARVRVGVGVRLGSSTPRAGCCACGRGRRRRRRCAPPWRCAPSSGVVDRR